MIPRVHPPLLIWFLQMPMVLMESDRVFWGLVGSLKSLELKVLNWELGVLPLSLFQDLTIR